MDLVEGGSGSGTQSANALSVEPAGTVSDAVAAFLDYCQRDANGMLSPQKDDSPATAQSAAPRSNGTQPLVQAAAAAEAACDFEQVIGDLGALREQIIAILTAEDAEAMGDEIEALLSTSLTT